jgi:protein ImuB
MSPSRSEELWLCLHFPLLPVEVFCREPEKPAVVLERQRIAFLNEPAFKMGIGVGNNMNTAYTISEKLASFERDEVKELARLNQLAVWAYQFTPSIVVRAPYSLLLEVSGCLKLFHGLDRLKATVAGKLCHLGHTVRLGVNGTPEAALCFAEAVFPDNTGSNSTEEVRESLMPLPIRYLQIDNSIKTMLSQMGIADCKALFDLPMDGLNRRFGVFFTRYLQRLTGDAPDPQKYISDKPSFASDITFMPEVSNLESLVFPLRRLLDELQEFLRGRQLMLNRFTVILSHRHHGKRPINVVLASPDNDARMFLTLTQLQLEKITDMPEVDNICLSAKTFFNAETPSGDLFQGTRFRQKDGRVHSKAEEDRALRLINMMTARLGPQACFGLSLANDHRPEAAWKAITLGNPQPGQQEVSSPPRPLYLLPTPQKLTSPNGSPALSGRLELLQGPERIDFGWWDGNEASRDYFLARHPSGAVYWIYQHLDNGNWYLHGIFS